MNSTQINFTTDWDMQSPIPGYGTQYNLKLFVASHEFFHAWNVKRLRPRPLGPFDYSQMVHTPSLWISEGLTSYYGALALERAGLITPQQYLDEIGNMITNFEQSPGRRERSIEDTSWDTWFNGTYTKEWGQKNNTNVIVDNINLVDLPARAASEAQAGKGHDLCMLLSPPAAGGHSRRASCSTRTV